jgi:hypothetical protein
MSNVHEMDMSMNVAHSLTDGLSIVKMELGIPEIDKKVDFVPSWCGGGLNQPRWLGEGVAFAGDCRPVTDTKDEPKPSPQIVPEASVQAPDIASRNHSSLCAAALRGPGRQDAIFSC